MADVIIHGVPASTYTRTALIACGEKGVSFELKPVEFGKPPHLALHPFGKIPMLADMFLAPILMYTKAQPDLGAVLARLPNLVRCQESVESRPAFAQTVPQASRASAA